MKNLNICYIGRPSYQKNTFFLLDVVKKVSEVIPSVKFNLLGVGYYSPDLEKTKEIISEHKLDKNIELHPWLEHRETLQCVKDSLFYLTVARYEGLPLSVLEAMSLSKAIIASDVVGNRDCVRNGYNGFLLPLKVELFAEKICYLVENVEERERMGRNSRLLFENNFLIDNKISQLDNIYMEMTLKSLL